MGGPQKAKMISDALGKSNFKGSQGWLEKWKKRFAIKQFNICGESGDVQGATLDSWKERLPELIGAYSKDNILNMDETGLFFRALPDRGFAQDSQLQRREKIKGKSHSCSVCVCLWSKRKACVDLEV